MISKYYKSFKLFSKNLKKSYSEKNLALFLIGISIVSVLVISVAWSLKRSDTSRLEIDINNQKRVFEGGTVSGMTVLDALSASASAGKLLFKYAIDPDTSKLTVFTLDGYTSGLSTKTLAVYLNHQKIEVDKIQSIPIKAGDGITVKLE